MWNDFYGKPEPVPCRRFAPERYLFNGIRQVVNQQTCLISGVKTTTDSFRLIDMNDSAFNEEVMGCSIKGCTSNASSVRNKGNEPEPLVASENYHIIVVTESLVDTGNTNFLVEFNLSTHSLLSCERTTFQEEGFHCMQNPIEGIL